MQPPYTEHAQINDALILQATHLVAKAGSTEHKIVGLLHLLAEWADLHYGRVMLPNYAASELQAAYSYGLDRDRLQRGDYNVAFDEGLTGAVWRSGRLALVTDIMDEPIFLKRIAEPINGKKTGVGFIALPIIANGKIIGVLSVQRSSDQARLYSQDVDLLRVIAWMVGSTLLQMCQPALTIVPVDAMTGRRADIAIDNAVRFDRGGAARKQATRAEPGYRPYLRVDAGERERIMDILARTGGNQTRAAELLGLTVRQLRYRIAKLG